MQATENPKTLLSSRHSGAFAWLRSKRTRPLLCAPLAGVSDIPFRVVCYEGGADLCYVEMLSSAAIAYHNQRTWQMMRRHPDEPRLGVQVTGRSAKEVSEAIRLLEDLPFDTVDINMGCPVKKVVKTGCGSGILKDPERVYETVARSRDATDKILSAKIRVGWDQDQINAMEVADAIERGGADFMTIHGRTRNEKYGDPVRYDLIAEVARSCSIPVIANGNIFAEQDADLLYQRYPEIAGAMISRGALGKPWAFSYLGNLRLHLPKNNLNNIDKNNTYHNHITFINNWHRVISRHVDLQEKEYQEKPKGIVCFRKHFLWYLNHFPKSWVKEFKEDVQKAESYAAIRQQVARISQAILERLDQGLMQEAEPEDLLWDPKYDMDRSFDRSVFEKSEPT